MSVGTVFDGRLQISGQKKSRQTFLKNTQEETEKMRARTAEMRQLKKELEDERLNERKEQIRIKAEEVRQAKERRRNPVKEEEPGD